MPPKNVKLRHSKPTVIWWVVTAIGVTVALAGLVNAYRVHQATSGFASVPTNAIIVEASNKPDEKKPNINADYIVSADQPRRIIIGSIGVDSFVQKVGITREKQISVPNNVHVAGWFVDSVRPGDAGVSIIDGHVSGSYSGDSVFRRLVELKAGNQFQIEFGDLQKKTFEVVTTRQLPEIVSAEFLLQQNNSLTSQLNLITCGGGYDKVRQKYADRFIVVSKLVDL